MKKILGCILLCCLLIGTSCFAEKIGFTQQDRERLVRLEATLKVFIQQVDKRFAELREDMNRGFEQVDKRFEKCQR